MGVCLRVCALAALVLLTAACASTEYKVAESSTADGTVLRSLDLQAEDVKYQAPCVVAVKQQFGRPVPISCVYVQTADTLHFLRFNETLSTYKPAVSVKIADLTTVAYQTFGLNRQVQVNRKGEVLAFHLVGANFVNTRLTEEVYTTLTGAGVASREPEKWIDLLPPQPVVITIPVYVGR